MNVYNRLFRRKKCVQFNTYLSKKDSYVCMGGGGGGGRFRSSFLDEIYFLDDIN